MPSIYMLQPMQMREQQGSVLIISMILLILLTVLAVSALQSTTVQERMAYNQHEAARSFAASESGLREGEFWIGGPQLTVRPVSLASGSTCTTPGTVPACIVWRQTRPTDTATCPGANCNNGPWLVASQATGADRYRDATWWTNNAVIYNSDGNGTTLPIVATQPAYVLEEVTVPGPQNVSGSLLLGGGVAARRYFFHVTARGVGRATVSEAVMQSVYARIF